MAKLFENVGSQKPGKSVFDLSYEKKFTCDMGMLIPVLHDVAIPSDVWEINMEHVIRAAPLVAPILHDIDVHIHVFFIPFRLLDDNWEDFITAGSDGASAATLGTWSPSDVTVGSLWDYMGMPTGVTPDADSRPLDLIKRGYNLVYNEYYRDPNLTAELNIETSEDVLYRCWYKDYFTSALPWQQRGTATALPIEGSAVWATDATASTNMIHSNANDLPSVATGATLNNNELDATTVNIADLRTAAAIQRWMELNARAGYRYVEQLGAHFGVDIQDHRLQRPEFIGGMKTPLIVSEVLQTESSDASTPLGELGGHGITADRGAIARYRVPDWGMFLGLLSIMPKPLYQQGINRQWLATSRYDWPFPLFANLSEQAILQREIYASGVKAENETVFGYQGKDDHHRYKPSMVCGLMRTDFDHWHLSRQFSSAPTLVTSFVEASTIRDDAWAVPSEPQFFVSVGNVIRAVRPLPYMSNPGLLRI